ncbi:hypothetical protein [Cellulomonas sp.]|uniref:hypothetical protein n=1 Tax=Cellulomonas sp. TaxID=40001 RepID=UPI002810ED0E|nr:hypothetical protein [Cellulomonas sp.]
MTFDPWGLLGALGLLGVVVAVRRYVRTGSVRRSDASPKDRSAWRRASWAERVATVVAVLLVLAVVVGRAIEPTPGWFWPVCGAAVLLSFGTAVWFHRRSRATARVDDGH